MDFLKSQFDRIQQQLAALTPSQKMLTGTLITIMVMTLLWWGKYAGTADMEPVLDQSLTQDEAGRIATELSQRHIEYKSSGDRVLVPADRKVEALALLSYNNALPKNTATGFDEIIKQLSPWDGTDRQNAMFNHGKELTLSQIIGGFPDVAYAAVLIDSHFERSLDKNIEPSAMISIQMKGGIRPSDQLVKAAASMVAGAQSGLALRNIKVTVNGAPQTVSDPGAADGTDPGSLAADREKEENRLARKVKDLFNDAQNLMVSVTVEVNNKTIVSDSTTVDQKKSFHMERRTQSENHEQTTPGAPAPSDTGTGPNTGLSLTSPAPAAAEGSSTENKETSEFDNVPALTHEKTSVGPGAMTPVSASVRIPRSYFVACARSLNAGKDPDDKLIKQTIDDEQPKALNGVIKAVGLTKDQVSLEVYTDAMPVAAAAPTISAASTMSMALGGHVKEIALGGLALVSLFMVTSMVKKAGPILPAIVAPAPDVATLRLDNGEAVAGEVAEGGNLLSGVELDEESVRNQQMMSQVSTLVDENPDTAATLVKRWLSQA